MNKEDVRQQLLDAAPDVAPRFIAEFVKQSTETANENLSQNTMAALDRLLDPQQTSDKDYAAWVAIAQATLQNVQTKRQRLALALAEGQMTGDIYRAADDQLIEHLEHATHLVTDTQARLAAIPSLDERRAALQKLIAAPDWLLDSPIEDVRPLLLRSGLRVHVENGQIVEVIISLKR